MARQDAYIRKDVRCCDVLLYSNPSVSGMGLKISLDIWRQVRYSTLGVRIRADERASPAATELCRS